MGIPTAEGYTPSGAASAKRALGGRAARGGRGRDRPLREHPDPRAPGGDSRAEIRHIAPIVRHAIVV